MRHMRVTGVKGGKEETAGEGGGRKTGAKHQQD